MRSWTLSCALVAVMAVVVACDGDSGDETGAAGASGAAGATGGTSGGGAAGASGGTSNAGAAGTGAGGKGGTGGASGGQVTCNQPGIHACTIYFTMNVEQTKKDCSGSDWSVVDHCPAAGLIGCCVNALGGSCIYEGTDPSIVMLKKNGCQPPSSTWTTTPP